MSKTAVDLPSESLASMLFKVRSHRHPTYIYSSFGTDRVRFIEFDTVGRSNLSTYFEKEDATIRIHDTDKPRTCDARKNFTERIHKGKDKPVVHINKSASFVLSRRAVRTDELRNSLSIEASEKRDERITKFRASSFRR